MSQSLSSSSIEFTGLDLPTPKHTHTLAMTVVACEWEYFKVNCTL